MSESDTELYTAARNRANRRPEGQYLMNGLYLPALIAVLNEVDRNAEDYSEYRWFASLDHRLQAVGGRQLGSSNANRWIDAQRILDMPFTKMPLIAEAESDDA